MITRDPFRDTGDTPAEADPHSTETLPLGLDETQSHAPEALRAHAPGSDPRRTGAPPSHIGVYPVREELGRGGMGLVYLAEDPRLHRLIAIKVIADWFSEDPVWRSRFEREARLLAAVNHPNIATIHSLESVDDTTFLTMEHVAGDTLTDVIACGPLDVDTLLGVGRQIAAALESAHRHGVVHRDLKPSNVKVTPEGDVKVLDFGLATSLRKTGGYDVDATGLSPREGSVGSDEVVSDGASSGTPGYMSPEQIRGGSVDQRADLWAFGCTLFECASGRQEFPGRNVVERLEATRAACVDWESLPAAVPERIRDLIERCLRPDVDARIQTSTDLRREDTQAMARRIALKARDDPGAGVVILVVARSAHNRLVLGEHREALRAQLPLDGATIARELRAGRVPRAGGIIVV